METRSAIKNTTKLAGTKLSAMMVLMATVRSVPDSRYSCVFSSAVELSGWLKTLTLLVLLVLAFKMAWWVRWMAVGRLW